MKCVKMASAPGGRVLVARLPDAVAAVWVERGAWRYTTKSVWKRAGRPVHELSLKGTRG